MEPLLLLWLRPALVAEHYIVVPPTFDLQVERVERWCRVWGLGLAKGGGAGALQAQGHCVPGETAGCCLDLL